MTTNKDALALASIELGDTNAYEAAVVDGASPNPGANQNVGNLRNDLNSGYAEAVRTKNIPMMLEILENTLAGTKMALSPMERELLYAAHSGDLNQIANALRGVRNPQIIDAARDIAQFSGNTEFANAMYSAGKIANENMAELGEKADQIQRNAILARNAKLQEQFRQHQENQESRAPRTRRRTAA